MSRQIILALLLLALVAVAIVILATKFGIGITPDSTVYIEAARNLLNGRGLIALAATGELKPMTHYPPLYPSLLALIGLTHVSIESAARWLQAILFGTNVLVVGLAIARYARASSWAPLIGALLMLTAPDIAGVHALALTEPLFVFLTITSLATLARFRETDRWSWLVAAGSLAALGVLTRYVGVTLIITGVVALLLAPHRGWRRRLGAAFFFGTIACLPLLLWLFRNVRLTGGETDRQLNFHPPGLKQVVAAFSTTASWLLVGKVRGDLRVGVFVAEVFLIGLFSFILFKEKRRLRLLTDDGSKSQTDRSPAQLAQVVVIFIVSYMFFIIIATTFFDLVIFDERTLLPVHVSLIILVTIFVTTVLARFPELHWIRIVLIVSAMALIGSYSFRSMGWFDRTRRDGQGYASRAWRESELIQRAKSLPTGTPIYSNAYDAVYYLSGRPAILIPEKTVFVTGRPNQNYEAELEKMGLVLRNRKGVLVYFNTLPERWYLLAESELRTRLALSETALEKDGTILGSR